MAKRPKLLPKAQSDATRLQLERMKLKAMIYGDKPFPLHMPRSVAVARLIEVQRELNRLFAGGIGLS